MNLISCSKLFLHFHHCQDFLRKKKYQNQIEILVLPSPKVLNSIKLSEFDRVEFCISSFVINSFSEVSKFDKVFTELLLDFESNDKTLKV